MKDFLKKLSATFILLSLVVTFQCGAVLAASSDAEPGHSHGSVAHDSNSSDSDHQEECGEVELEFTQSVNLQELAGESLPVVSMTTVYETHWEIKDHPTRGSPGWTQLDQTLLAFNTVRLIN